MKIPPTEGAGVRSTDPWTSHLAAMHVPVTKLEAMFCEALRVHGRLTTTEIANVYGMDRDSFSPRPPALIRKRWIVRDGHRVCLNSSGKPRKMIAFRLRRADDK